VSNLRLWRSYISCLVVDLAMFVGGGGRKGPPVRNYCDVCEVLRATSDLKPDTMTNKELWMVERVDG